MQTKSATRTLIILTVVAIACFGGWKLYEFFADDGLTADGEVPVKAFFDLAEEEPERATAARELISKNWRPGYAIMLSEQMKFTRAPFLLARILKEHVPEYADFEDWNVGIWNHEYEPHSQYAEFKSQLYSHLDPRFREYFDPEYPASIRLDEIQWGGVKRDGIPPLDKPKMISASEADYLEGTNVIFGIEIDGDARAYPKRILGWHEMFKDTVGGESVNGVYCTLCGSMILYKTTFDGVHHELGTSGFLYRSNKLMYDHETKSLWSTMQGKPVVGPLVEKGITLETLPVVTTTWAKWLADHPTTTVLSLETGHDRDYGEGVAYSGYFDSPYLMFEVPKQDDRMLIKDEILAIRHGDPKQDALAIAADFLQKTPVYSDNVCDTDIVVLTNESGANRVYESTGAKFSEWDGTETAIDSEGNEWTVSEDSLSNSALNKTLPRLPAHRAFWFGWFATHPKTRLVQ